MTSTWSYSHKFKYDARQNLDKVIHGNCEVPSSGCRCILRVIFFGIFEPTRSSSHRNPKDSNLLDFAEHQQSLHDASGQIFDCDSCNISINSIYGWIFTSTISKYYTNSSSYRWGAVSIRPQKNHSNELRLIKLPKFWRKQSKLWFAHLESEFTVYWISSDDVKYSSVVRRLDEQALIAVAELIKNPPEKDKYMHLKKSIN